MKYDFDKIVDRHGTDCYKWDMIAKRKLPADTLPLWVADMDFETVPEVKERLKEVADRGIYGYSMLGDGYYHALKNWFSERFGWQVEKDWVIVTPGVVFALAAAVRAYTKEGDSVMIQRPVYHPFTNVVKENGRKLVNNPLVMENGKYHMDYEDMERKITEEQVKLFLLCSPHNPVSRVWTKEELCQAAEICKKHGVIMIVDEIHCDFVYEGYHHTSFGTLSEYADNAVICTAPSKTFNLAELQLSNIMIPNPELRKTFQAEMDKVFYSDANLFGQVSCQAAYEYGAQWLDELRVYLQGNIIYIRDYLAEHLPKVHLIEPEGTYLLWADFREYGLSAEALNAKILKDARIWFNEGSMFGPEGAGFMRINIASPRSMIVEAMERLGEVFGE